MIARANIRPPADEPGAPGDGRAVQGIVYEPVRDQAFLAALLELFSKRKPRRGKRGAIVAEALPLFRGNYPLDPEQRKPRLLAVEQSNTSVVFGERFIFKLSRVIERGARGVINPDVEIGRFLTEHEFAHAPALAGVLTYQIDDVRSALGVLQTFLRNQGDAWKFTLGRSAERAKAAGLEVRSPADAVAGATLVAFLTPDITHHTLFE